jgi:hypothetical protein
MSLLASSEAALDCLGVTGEDAVAVVCNVEQRTIAEALADAAGRRARSVMLLEFAATSRHGEEPPAEVAEAMVAADVVLAPTSMSLSLTSTYAPRVRAILDDHVEHLAPAREDAHVRRLSSEPAAGTRERRTRPDRRSGRRGLVHIQGAV